MNFKVNIRAVGLLAVLVMAAILPGCNGFGANLTARPLNIQPVGKKDIVAIQPNFKTIYYRIDRDQNIYVVMQNEGGRKAAGGVTQAVVMRIFWQPKGGKTSLNGASLNATYRYIVTTPKGVGMYEGAGFVRFFGKVGDKKLRARVIDGDLRLTEASPDFVDTLGRSIFHGAFTAKQSDSETLARTLNAQREFFIRTFKYAQANGPATTQPAEETP